MDMQLNMNRSGSKTELRDCTLRLLLASEFFLQSLEVEIDSVKYTMLVESKKLSHRRAEHHKQHGLSFADVRCDMDVLSLRPHQH